MDVSHTRTATATSSSSQGAMNSRGGSSSSNNNGHLRNGGGGGGGGSMNAISEALVQYQQNIALLQKAVQRLGSTPPPAPKRR
jgi:hypothetical protein